MRAAIVLRSSRVRRPCDPCVPSLPAGKLSCSTRTFWRCGTVDYLLSIYFHYKPGGFRYAQHRLKSPPMLMPCLPPPNRPSPKPHPSWLGAACMLDRCIRTKIIAMVVSLPDESPLGARFACTWPRPRASNTCSRRNVYIYARHRAFILSSMECLVRACEGPRGIEPGRTDFRAWRGHPACVINICTT